MKRAFIRLLNGSRLGIFFVLLCFMHGLTYGQDLCPALQNFEFELKYRDDSRSISSQDITRLSEIKDSLLQGGGDGYQLAYLEFLLSKKQDFNAITKMEAKVVDIRLLKLKVFYHLEKGQDELALIALKELASRGYFTSEILLYAKHLLLSCTESALLFTHGEDDGLAVLYQSLVKSIRADVLIVPLEQLYSHHGLSKCSDADKEVNPRTFKEWLKESSLCTNRQIHLSMTIPKGYFEKIVDELYVVGLVFVYDSKAFNNYYQNDFLFSEILENEELMKMKKSRFSNNYLLMYYALKEWYESTKETEKIKRIELLMRDL